MTGSTVAMVTCYAKSIIITYCLMIWHLSDLDILALTDIEYSSMSEMSSVLSSLPPRGGARAPPLGGKEERTDDISD